MASGGLLENNWKEHPMAKITDGGWLPADDPIFNGQWMVFSVHKSTPPTKSGAEEKPEKQSPKSSVSEPEKPK
jgi:hypothetical protein